MSVYNQCDCRQFLHLFFFNVLLCFFDFKLFFSSAYNSLNHSGIIYTPLVFYFQIIELS